MKVRELIEELRKLPQDAKVVVVESVPWSFTAEEREPLTGSFTGLGRWEEGTVVL